MQRLIGIGFLIVGVIAALNERGFMVVVYLVAAAICFGAGSETHSA